MRNLESIETLFKNTEKYNEIKPSKSYIKTLQKHRKISRKIARRRDNYNHQITADIVRKSNFIGIEGLTVKDMYNSKKGQTGTHKFNDRIADAAMSTVLINLKYKADWYGVELVTIGKYEPSSQLCHVCGYQNKKLGAVKEWTCPVCGTHHDRDINAAKNILAMALKKKQNTTENVV